AIHGLTDVLALQFREEAHVAEVHAQERSSGAAHHLRRVEHRAVAAKDDRGLDPVIADLERRLDAVSSEGLTGYIRSPSGIIAARVGHHQNAARHLVPPTASSICLAIAASSSTGGPPAPLACHVPQPQTKNSTLPAGPGTALRSTLWMPSPAC